MNMCLQPLYNYQQGFLYETPVSLSCCFSKIHTGPQKGKHLSSCVKYNLFPQWQEENHAA